MIYNTIRRNILNWCNLVSISKKLSFYVFRVVRIYKKKKKKNLDEKICNLFLKSVLLSHLFIKKVAGAL